MFTGVIVTVSLFAVISLVALVLSIVAYVNSSTTVNVPEPRVDIALVSELRDGLMSASDKEKLDNFTSIVNATPTMDGLMCATDKAKLDGIGDLQTTLTDLENSLAPVVNTRAPLSTDDETKGAMVGGTWIDEGTGLTYVCVFAGADSALWKKTTNVSAFLQWQIQKHGIAGGGVDSYNNGWIAREFNDDMIISSGSEVSLLPGSPKTQIQIINVETSAVTYNISAKSAGRNIGITEIRWIRVSDNTPIITSSVMNSESNNQVYPELFGRFMVPSLSTAVFELEQFSSVSGYVQAGLGFGSNTPPSVFVDIVITKIT